MTTLPSFTRHPHHKKFRRTGSLFTVKHLSLVFSAVVIMPICGISTAQAATNEVITEKVLTVETQTEQSLFLECAKLHLASARLACYDKVANVGETPAAINEKNPLDIAKTVKESLNQRKPKLVFAVDDLPSTDENPNPSDTTEVASRNTPSDSEKTRLAETPLTDKDILNKVGVSQRDVQKYTPLSLAYDLDANSELGIWSARPYNPMYLMPIFATDNPNRTPHTPTLGGYTYTSNEYRAIELKAQLSLKTKVMQDLFDTNADLWFGYTQQMHWQVYNEDNSRPFRANDYMPELFVTQPVKASLPFGGELRMLGAGAIHHSNGQSDPLSRSWNRLYLVGGAEWGKLSIIPKVWTHIKNESEANPSDNPDITDYYGNGEIKALYDFSGGKTLGVTGRLNPSEGKGALQVDYTYPFDEDIYGYLQIFHGYGESIVDYNHKSTSIGVGITLSDWQGL